MSVTRCEIRPGAYADSIVLMHLQSSLAALDGVEDAGVVMGTPANLELLESNDLLHADVSAAAPDDLVLVVRAASDQAAADALSQVDDLLATRKQTESDADFRPHGLPSAFALLPSAALVTIAVPGRYAVGVAREALEHGRHAFLYSDNVSLEDEVALKKQAREAGLLVMGPDCGTAILAGLGLGFANRVRRGGIGLVGASGTGLQAVTSTIHTLGAGVSHAIGTGGRDLKDEVGGITALQALDLLSRDDETEVIVVISKPPSPEVAERVLASAASTGKPVVVQFLGRQAPSVPSGNVHFSNGLDGTAELAVELLGGDSVRAGTTPRTEEIEQRSGVLRGLFAGGTLALEAQQAFAGLGRLSSNEPMVGSERVADLTSSAGHTILDLGADEFTVGRLHPMMDQDLRIRRLRQEAADPETGVILLDLVLGEGSHPDPATELAPAIEAARVAGDADVVVVMVGTDLDPQGLGDQRERLEAAGALVFDRVSEGFAWVAARLGAASTDAAEQDPPPTEQLPIRAAGAEAAPAVDPAALAGPLSVVNVGLESFRDSMVEQGADVVQLDWRPPAGGDEKLMALLERLR